MKAGVWNSQTEVEWSEAVEFAPEDSSSVGAVGYSRLTLLEANAWFSLLFSFSSSMELTSA